MTRVIGNISECVPKNSLLEGFQQWLRRFDGCEFTEEDWEAFKRQVANEVQSRNSAWKSGKNLIMVSFNERVIFVCCQDSACGNHSRQMTVEVIRVRSEYDRQRGITRPVWNDEDAVREGGAS
ncbi:MAG: hypothetical protein IJV42_01740 [Bacteroidaceae bacterium]|nr:hypothetical protein [Bacteroidaceae bacterium]